MANLNPLSFLLNDGGNQCQTVAALTFSMTKVISTAAVILTPLTTLLVKQIADVKFSSGEVVTLILGVLGLLSITSAADVLARAIATRSSLAGGVSITPALKAKLIADGEDPAVQVVGLRTSGGDTAPLISEAGKPLPWVPAGSIVFG